MASVTLEQQIARITRMEQILCDAQAALAASTLDAELAARIAELSAYYGSSDWFADYDADCAGLLPKDLRRGVLSEDAVYDLLMQYSNLQQ